MSRSRRILASVAECIARLPASVWALSRGAFIAAYRDNAFGYAKSAAYSSLLAFFPLLATSAAILVKFRAQFIFDPIYSFLSEILPPGTQDLVFYYFAIKGKQPAFVLITGVLVSVWAGSGVMVSLMQGFHVAYRVPSGRPFVRERIIAILLVFSAAIPVLFASALVLFGARAQALVVGWVGPVPAGRELRGWVIIAGHAVRYLAALAAIVLGACILYYVGPNRPQRWSRVWPGAIMATGLWLAATLAFAWYEQNVAHYNVMYGSIATVILLLVWMYLLAVIAYAGCEFNAAYERTRR